MTLPPPAPAAPTGLTAAPVSSSRIDLSWTDLSGNESGFKVERSVDGVSFGPIATTGANTATYADTSLAPASTYHYRVRAYNAGGDSAYSNTAHATTHPQLTPPAAPANLTAAAVSSSRIDLAWTDPSNNEDGFRIERSPDGVTFSLLATVGLNATNHADLGLAGATTYHYRVRAYNGAGNSSYTNTATATTPPNAPTLPAAPSSLTATAKSRTRINLAWTDNAGNETGFKIERSRDQATWKQIATVGPNVTSFSSAGLKRNRHYYYRVRASNGTGDSPYSNIASARTLR
jgi:predicted phage tail protein